MLGRMPLGGEASLDLPNRDIPTAPSSEHRHGTVTDALVDEAAMVGHDAVNYGEETIEQTMDLFRTNLAAQACVADKVGKEHGDLSPFGIGGVRPSYPRHRYINPGRRGSQSGDRLKQFAAMPDRRDTQVLQIVRRELWQHIGIDGVFAKRGFVLLKAETLQPSWNIHGTPRRSA